MAEMRDCKNAAAALYTRVETYYHTSAVITRAVRTGSRRGAAAAYILSSVI